MQSVKGRYQGGIIYPAEPLEGREGQEVLITLLPDAEGALLDEWQAVSARSLQEVWDNDEDAVYDHA